MVIMSPIRNRKRGVFGLNIKISICRGYTKIFLKISPCGRGERKCEFLPVFWTISLKISKLASRNLEPLKIVQKSGNLCPSFSPFPQPGNSGVLPCMVYIHTKVYVEAKKLPFSIFHRGHDGPFSLPYSVKLEFPLG